VSEIAKLLRKRRYIKIKLLHSFVEGNDRKKAAKDLALDTKSEIIDQTGFVVVLYKR